MMKCVDGCKNNWRPWHHFGKKIILYDCEWKDLPRKKNYTLTSENRSLQLINVHRRKIINKKTA